MKDILIERYESPKVNIYKSNGDFYGVLNNEHEFNIFRNSMLIEYATSEYYFMCGDIKIVVNEKGDMDKFPSGLYDKVQIELCKTYNIIKERRNKNEKN